MNKKGAALGSVIMIFLAIIVSLVLIQQIFNEQAIMTSKNTITDEAKSIASYRYGDAGNINETIAIFTVTNAPTGWKIEGCPITSLVYGNASDDFELDVDYTFTASTGTISLIDSEAIIGSSNDTFIDYVYCPDGYNKDSSSRNIAAIIGLLCVVGLFVIVAMSAWKQQEQ